MESLNEIATPTKSFRSVSVTKWIVESDVKRLLLAISDAQLMALPENALVRQRFLKLSPEDWSSTVLDEIEKRYI